MSTPTVPITTLAPVPGEPVFSAGPALPDPPPELAGGASGLGALPDASLRIRTLPQRYLLGAIIPLAIGVLLTILSALVRWPVPR